MKIRNENINHDFRFNHGRISFDNPLSLLMVKKNILNEGLIKTYDLNSLKKYLQDYFKLQDNHKVFLDNENNVETGNIHIPNLGDNVKLIDKALNFCGYYISTTDEFDFNGEPWVTLQFEPKFQENKKDEIISKHQYLIHITPLYNLEKILKNGLSPKSKNKAFDYHNRVYLLYDFEPNKPLDTNIRAIHLGSQLCKKNDSVGNNGKYVFLRIDIKQIGDIGLYYDPNLIYGCYTRENISPSAIVDYATIDFNDYE